MKITEIKKCRLCGGEIKDMISFGDVALANAYIKPEDVDIEELKTPLVIVKCNDCGHVQLKHTVNKESLFSNYLYSSSTSGSLTKYFKNYTEEIINELKLQPNEGYILELGSNDGVALQHFINKGFRVIGVDPASNLAKIANDKGIFTINKFFNRNVAQGILNEYGYPSCIICSNVYAHLEEHDSFTDGIRFLLNYKNAFVFENAYLLPTIRNLYFDQCYIEHVSYYGIVPLCLYFDKFNLEIFKIIQTPNQGGSIRVFVKKKENENYQIEKDNIKNLIDEEIEFGLYEDKTYQQFIQKLEKIKQKLLNVISDYTSISCYGCPAKFALFSKFFGLNRKNVKYVVDDSTFKQKLLAPESKIPIVDRDYFLKNPTNICIISAWNFADLIKTNNPQYKGKWINPFEL